MFIASSLALLLFGLSVHSTDTTTNEPETTTSGAKAAIRSAIGAVLRGDGASARTILLTISKNDLDNRDAQLRACTLDRLTMALSSNPSLQDIPTIDPFARDVLALYRTYWRSSIMDEGLRPMTERALVAGLAQLLDQPDLESVDKAEPMIAARLLKTKLFSQQGMTGIFRDLMIWSSDSVSVERVKLPEGSNQTRVRYLNNFLSRGWSSYLTCDRAGTGGWTTDDGLFVVVPSYESLTDENFRVNFLAHESQHYADKKRFGELPAWRLEFRAKLVELAYADATRDRIVDNFISNLSGNPADAHSYANTMILSSLMRRLRLTSVQDLHNVTLIQLHAAAIDELKYDSEQLTLVASLLPRRP